MALGALAWIAEQRIAQAVAQGKLSNLPGEGRPLSDDIDPLVPEELRVMIRVLKHAGAVPWQVQAWRELRALESAGALQPRCDSAGERQKIEQRLLELRVRLEHESPDSVRHVVRVLGARRGRAAGSGAPPPQT
jgi:hypothetical protein